MRPVRLLPQARGSLPIRSAMSDAALPQRRPAALENPAPSKAMKAAAGKTWGGWGVDVGSSYPAAGMETPDARKTWGGWRIDVDSRGPAKPMQTTSPS
jgi:hypothetical protein